MKGVVLWIAPDRHPLAGSTNTNKSALIAGTQAESTHGMEQSLPGCRGVCGGWNKMLPRSLLEHERPVFGPAAL